MKNSVQLFVLVISGVLIVIISGDLTTITSDTTTDDYYNCSTVPGPVLNLTTKVNSSSVLLSWDPPENSECVEQYVIKLNNQFIGVTSHTSYPFINLTFCISYNFTVIPETVGSFSRGVPNTLKEELYPEVLDPVQYLDIPGFVNPDEVIRFSWSVPYSAYFCTVTYEILVTNYNSVKVNTTRTFFEIDTKYVTPCSEIKVSVTPILRDVVGQTRNASIKVAPKVPHPPILTNYTTGSTWIRFNWKIDVAIYNCSTTNLINVSCVSEERAFSLIENVTKDDISINKTELVPFTTYLCWAYTANLAGQSNYSKVTNITTNQAPPSSPTHLRVESLSSTSFTIAWERPKYIPGLQGDYRLEIDSEGPLHYIPEFCNVTREYNLVYSIGYFIREYNFLKATPNFGFRIRLAASTGAGFGDFSQMSIVTPSAGPEPVRDLKYMIKYFQTEQYQTEIYISFNPPCNTNGNLSSYDIILSGSRSNYNSYIYEIQLQKLQPILRNLSAGYNYNLTVTAATKAGSGTPVIKQFIAPDGVPPKMLDSLIEPEQIDSGTAKFVFSNRLFSDVNGDIIYYAIILADADFNESTYGFWNYSQNDWPFVGLWNDEAETILPYQATPDYWNPFRECSKVCNYTYILGDSKCTPNTTCNGSLRKDRKYSLILRGFTRHGYRDSLPIFFVMCDPASPIFKLDVAKFIGAIVGALSALTLFGFMYMIWKKQNRSPKPTNAAPKLSEMDNLQPMPVPIPVNKFPEVYRDLKVNSQKIKQQYTLINTKSSEEMLPYYAALLPNNRKKNRYTNILPFDETRVKLINEKEPRNDYINASFIKGYSGKIEYIATQGPLAYTCADFWKMIIQENVTVIAMVAHFVEMNQPKCYKYFPNKHENMDVGEGIEVRCATELNFGMYCLRTLLIQKDLKQWTITHLQFLDWPDHGCPTGTEVMIHFCYVLRQHIAKLPGIVAVHCSAGVGRTGTLIAVDMLLQAVKDKRDIDIFGTVLNLRRQRAKMVQTEKQYWYIHSCIFDVIDNPKLLNWEQAENESEPIYENLEEVKINSKESQL
ncbi:receptor-type tyrosine-protein phosphatase eta-like isoform X2 [Agrilus planipennis]|uniref:protein-tyrosine-phosphatase n=1 Tax=Agrilus planipennis TaxID=224129 RepID=A0A1W4WEF8_AGRPL|nr:receptor-type tyrosine-protein phosphatase eta-like isoform X2 [Agrilus planipennis]